MHFFILFPWLWSVNLEFDLTIHNNLEKQIPMLFYSKIIICNYQINLLPAESGKILCIKTIIHIRTLDLLVIRHTQLLLPPNRRSKLDFTLRKSHVPLAVLLLSTSAFVNPNMCTNPSEQKMMFLSLCELQTRKLRPERKTMSSVKTFLWQGPTLLDSF